MIKTKADKLIDRGSENPEVARAAREVSDMLMRMALGQPKYFAECVERVFPDMTLEEAESLEQFFISVSYYFGEKSKGVNRPTTSYNTDKVRSWASNEDYFYKLHKVFCILACNLDSCADNFDCWETRSAFCRMDETDNSTKGW